MFGNDLIAQANSEDRPVPEVVSRCIDVVEKQGKSPRRLLGLFHVHPGRMSDTLNTGLDYEGIYRKTGGMGQTKTIQTLFERGSIFDLDNVDEFNDLSAITSVLKNYFRALPNPLFTHELHEEFVTIGGERGLDV